MLLARRAGFLRLLASGRASRKLGHGRTAGCRDGREGGGMLRRILVTIFSMSWGTSLDDADFLFYFPVR